MSAVFDFKSIRSKLERQEQKAEHEAQNPPPPAWYSKPVVWTPNGGYGPSSLNEAARKFMAAQPRITDWN